MVPEIIMPLPREVFSLALFAFYCPKSQGHTFIAYTVEHIQYTYASRFILAWFTTLYDELNILSVSTSAACAIMRRC